LTITHDTLISVPTISDDGVRAKLAGTPMESWADTFIAKSRQYQLDPNWVMGYLQWETGFGSAGPGGIHPSMLFNDPWDLLCGVPDGACGAAGFYGSIECRRAPNGYCYHVYASMEAGIEAGYLNWQSYIQRGWNTYWTSLSVALCGVPAGCASTWVDSVIAQANDNAARWPYTGEPPPPPPPLEASGTFAMVLGLGFLVGGAATWWLTKQGRPPLASLFRR
jgi:hypothetical protein